MAVIFDEITADVQAPTPPPAVTGNPSTASGGQIDPQVLAQIITLQGERAARLHAD